MADDWVDKLIREDDNRKREADEKSQREAEGAKRLRAQWPGWAASLKDEAAQRVDKFNQAMKSRRATWLPLVVRSTADNFTVGRGDDMYVNVVVDHAAHRVSITKFSRGREEKTHYEVRSGAGHPEVYRTHYSDAKHVADLIEEVLRPVFEGAMYEGNSGPSDVSW